MRKKSKTVHQIELRLGQLSELFNSMDPTPFHHRDLDARAEEFLESWALEFPQNSQFRIIVHIEEAPPGDAEVLVGAAIHNYFGYKAILAKRSLRLLLVEGRTSLLIGVSFLAACLAGADRVSGTTDTTFLRLAEESLLIGGWVAMWHPMQILLYGWWPIVRKIRIYRNLGRATVHVAPGTGRSDRL